MPRPAKRSPSTQMHVAKPEVRALPIRKFAQAHGIHETTVWRALKEGRLTYVVIGKRKLVLLDSLQQPQ